jgi:hypothetical protein
MIAEKFEVLKVKQNPKLEEYSDFKLVRLSQRDIDNFRKNCYWKCNICGKEINYLDSLLIRSSYYVHEMRCPEKKDQKRSKKEKSCNKKMKLIRRDGMVFSSIYFNELFARYQHRLIKESMDCSSIDYPDDVYSYLITAFSKIVPQFAREEELIERSDKWFSSFFWKSIQNKIADLNKTNNYSIRNPTITCSVCGQQVTQINKKHLMSEDHEEIYDYVIKGFGKNILLNSSNYVMKNTEEYDKLCFQTGLEYIARFSEKTQLELIETECINAYMELYPGSFLKNKIMSINEKIGEDSEFADFATEDFFDKNQNTVEDLSLKNHIEQLTNIVIKNSINLKKYLKNKELFKQTVNDSILLKIDYPEMDYDKIDDSLRNACKGFTKALISFIRRDKECRIYFEEIIERKISCNVGEN